MLRSMQVLLELLDSCLFWSTKMISSSRCSLSSLCFVEEQHSQILFRRFMIFTKCSPSCRLTTPYAPTILVKIASRQSLDKNNLVEMVGIAGTHVIAHQYLFTLQLVYRWKLTEISGK